ncbi:hypothetical protein F2P81_017896 [Scophthalmus maximus]|uniref:Uncharacterized protein n=1 Tax=Scophthalmus maximus TaxID=52904 RepID=A0A6A4SCH2_SCOMX|nr:hypothetical protein F2P81_017896 [Scophthalmus maximus]
MEEEKIIHETAEKKRSERREGEEEETTGRGGEDEKTAAVSAPSLHFETSCLVDRVCDALISSRSLLHCGLWVKLSAMPALLEEDEEERKLRGVDGRGREKRRRRRRRRRLGSRGKIRNDQSCQSDNDEATAMDRVEFDPPFVCFSSSSSSCGWSVGWRPIGCAGVVELKQTVVDTYQTQKASNRVPAPAALDVIG